MEYKLEEFLLSHKVEVYSRPIDYSPEEKESILVAVPKNKKEDWGQLISDSSPAHPYTFSKTTEQTHEVDKSPISVKEYLTIRDDIADLLKIAEENNENGLPMPLYWFEEGSPELQKTVRININEDLGAVIKTFQELNNLIEFGLYRPK